MCLAAASCERSGDPGLSLNPEWNLLTWLSGWRCRSWPSWEGPQLRWGREAEADRDFCSSVYLRAAQAGKKMGGKNAPVVPRKTIEMGFIAGRGLGLHASTVFFETVWSHLSCLQHLSSHQKFSSVSWQFFFCRWQFTSTSLPAEGRNLYKIHTVFTWILFHITQAGCRPLNAVQRIKAGHSL